MLAELDLRKLAKGWLACCLFSIFESVDWPSEDKMAPPQELILSSSSSYVAPSTAAPSKRATFAPISSTPSSSSGPSYSSTIALHDLTTSSLVHTFKPSGGTSLHGLSHINSRQGKGGLLFGAQEGKALLHVWAWQKDQLHLKLHLPEKLACFEVSPNGIWAAGGTTTGHVYLWEVSLFSLLPEAEIHRSLSRTRLTDLQKTIQLSR